MCAKFGDRWGVFTLSAGMLLLLLLPAYAEEGPVDVCAANSPHKVRCVHMLHEMHTSLACMQLQFHGLCLTAPFFKS